jgi:hypothetical protein
MYCEINFKSKKALVEAVKSGRRLTVFQTGPFNNDPRDKEVTIEGPHYPMPHKWYARVHVNGEGVIDRVLS